MTTPIAEREKKLLYFGVDQSLFDLLRGQQDWTCRHGIWGLENKYSWRTPIILDVNVADRPGFEMLRSLKGKLAFFTVLGVADNMPLTQLALAKSHGAHSFAWRDDLEIPELVCHLENLHQKIQRWIQHFRGTESRM